MSSRALSEITAFITARLDYLAAIARPATGGSWYAPEIPALAPGGYPRWRVDIVTGELQSPQGIADCLVSHADAEHIAAWDPPHVFDHINTMRRILERHVPHRYISFGPHCRVCASEDNYTPRRRRHGTVAVPHCSRAGCAIRRSPGLRPGLARRAAMTPDPATNLLTAREAAAAAHVPTATCRSWVHRRLLVPIQTPDGPRYRELDVLDVEAATALADGRRDARLLAESVALLPELLESARGRANSQAA